jgi:hypothetical protein
MRKFLYVSLSSLALVGSASAAVIVVSAEAHVDSMTVMNLGEESILVDFLAQPASQVDHSVLGTTYAIPSVSIFRWHIPSATASGPLSFRVHEMRCDGTTRCAGEATDIVPSSGTRNVVVRDSNGTLYKTVFNISWDEDSHESYAVLENALPSQALSFVLTDGVAARTITISDNEVDPGNQTVVIGAPPLVSPQSGILDPFVHPPSVYPQVPIWGADSTFGDPLQ